MAPSFEFFGPAHLGAIALTFATPLALCAIRRLVEREIVGAIVRGLLVATLVGAKALWFVLLLRDGRFTIANGAPMELCDWAAITAAATVIYPNQYTYELCYFWALGGTLQALLTPDLDYGFPDPRFVSFFALHGGVIAAALYMTLCMGLRPFPMSIVRALGWSAVYLVVAMATNAALGANFGYLRAKPAQASLMDAMAPWPFYIGQLVLLAIAFTLLYYSPFFLIDRRRRRRGARVDRG